MRFRCSNVWSRRPVPTADTSYVTTYSRDEETTAVGLAIILGVLFALLAIYSLYSTITLDLKPTDERLFDCGKPYINECADRLEYAWVASWTAGIALLSTFCFI